MAKRTSAKELGKDLRVSAHLIAATAHASRCSLTALMNADTALSIAATNDPAFAVVEEATEITRMIAQVNATLVEIERLAVKIVRHEEAKGA